METTNSMTGGAQVARLLRCRKSQRYFSEGGWTQEAAQAKTFPNQLAAVQDCIQHGLINVELVLRAPGSSADLFTCSLR